MKPDFVEKIFSTKTAILVALYAVTIAIFAASLLLKPEETDSSSIFHFLILFFASVFLTKHFFYMIVSPLHDVRTTIEKKYWKKERPNYYPLVSVVVPAWNEEVGIIHTLLSVLGASYERIEVVVVNDGSTDNSDELIKVFIERYNKIPAEVRGERSIVYRYQQNGGKGAALNTAISISSGDIIVSVDADCLLEEDTIANFVEYFRNPYVAAAVGNVKIGNTKSFIGLTQALEFLFSFYFKKADSFLNTIYIIGGAAGAFRREVFEELGGYSSQNITEDIELSMRIQDAGLRIVYASDAVVYTEGASDLESLKKQRLRWKRGRFQTFGEYWHMFFSRQNRHNKLLSWFVLPLALLGEFQLLFELPFIAFILFYSIFASNFLPLASGIIFVITMFFIQVIFDDRVDKRLSFCALAPTVWLFFYVIVFVDVNALIKSIVGLVRGEEVKWQRWQRKGLLS
jgi:poly-beta-1,6-N-acetyl-D-glucosamine synthase